MIAARWGGYVLEGVASILVARYTGPAGKGILAVLNVLSGFAIQMGNLGLHAATAYFAAREAEALSRIAWTSLLLAPAIGIVMSAALGVGIGIFPAILPSIPTLFIAISLLSIPLALVIMFFQNILLGQQRIGAYILLDVGGKALALPLIILILVFLQGGVRELLIAGLCLISATAILAVRLAFQGVTTRFAFDHALLRRMLAYGLRSYLSCVFAYLILRSDMLLVNYFLGSAQAGIYAVAVNLADLLLVFPTAVGTMLFPRISSRVTDDGILTAAVSRHTAAGMLLLCAGAWACAHPLIVLLFGRAFRDAATPFLLLLPGILALSLEIVFMNDLAGRGLPPVVIAVPGIGLVINLALNVALIPHFGLNAAAISSSVAYSVMLVIAWKAFARRTVTSARTCYLITHADVQALFARLLEICRRNR